METLRNVQPTARKEHKCEYCGGIIHVGEKYDRQTIVLMVLSMTGYVI